MDVGFADPDTETSSLFRGMENLRSAQFVRPNIFDLSDLEFSWYSLLYLDLDSLKVDQSGALNLRI